MHPGAVARVALVTSQWHSCSRHLHEAWRNSSNLADFCES
jgi:hypothetical protein